MKCAKPALNTAKQAKRHSAQAADFRLMVEGVTGSLQFAKLCSIYLTPCSGGL
jgi:hypothetical protein